MHCEAVGKGGRAGGEITNVQRQFFASLLLRLVPLDNVGILLELAQTGDEILNLVLDVVEFLRPPMSARSPQSPVRVNRHLIMLDECADPTKSRLEGRQPIRGLLRYVEEYLCTIRDSLLLC